MEPLNQCYAIYGCGGWEACNVIQDRLSNHGLCSFSRWEPTPPNWRFFYETNLKASETLDLLGHYTQRYNVQIK